MTAPTLLRRAIESVGIEKRSDYTLVLEELERLMDADRELIQRIVDDATDGDSDVIRAHTYVAVGNALNVGRSECAALIRAATEFVKEAEEMGFGKTSEKALPGGFDALIEALSRIQGIQSGA